MKYKLTALLAGGALTGFLAMNGISLASAQESTTTTTAPAASPEADTGTPRAGDDPSCPHKGDRGSTTTPAPGDTTTTDADPET